MSTPGSARASLSIQCFTSSEAGAWSNSYLISGKSDAILFDVFMLASDAAQIADGIAKSAKTLKTVMISHAHPDHFMGLEVITERFPRAQVVSTANVVADIRQDGPWILSLLQGKLGAHGPKRVVVPEILTEPVLNLEGNKLEVVEFGEGESKHNACVYLPELKALLLADLVYNNAHLYLQERHLQSWLGRLDELEVYAKTRVTTIYPGHGAAGDLSLITQTRAYLRDFASAINSGDAKLAEKQMLDKYPDYHVRQFLTAFTIPAYFPPP
ncbi:MAG TPA: MBL fold metallo-hydrolase [Terriglobia bacterium]|nr:MBL fold metallo-hydrolase [Terriglobia bacterium]